jgi:hypothetical protein
MKFLGVGKTLVSVRGVMPRYEMDFPLVKKW